MLEISYFSISDLPQDSRTRAVCPEHENRRMLQGNRTQSQESKPTQKHLVKSF